MMFKQALEPLVVRPRIHAQAAIACVAIASAAASLLAEPGLRGAVGALLALVMLAIAIVDARRRIIPNELNAVAFALALAHAVIQSPDAVTEALAVAVLRGAALALLFLGLRVAYRHWRDREGIGLGDVKLAAVAGAWLDWLTIPIAIEIAALSALAVYGVRQYWLGARLRPTTRLPFGLFFAPAIWLGWLIETLMLVPPYGAALF